MEDKLSLEELEEMEEVELEIDGKAFQVDKGICPTCNEAMIKIVENKDVFDGAITFHIIKFKCGKCHKEYLDLEEAEKYDLYLNLARISKEGKPLEFLHQCLIQGKVVA